MAWSCRRSREVVFVAAGSTLSAAGAFWLRSAAGAWSGGVGCLSGDWSGREQCGSASLCVLRCAGICRCYPPLPCRRFVGLPGQRLTKSHFLISELDIGER